MKFPDVSDLVAAKKVIMKEKDGLRLFTYSRDAFRNQDFNDPRMLDCRGIVVDSENNIISRPFSKLFNYGEKFAPDVNTDTMVVASHKVNGFMLAVSLYQGKPLFTTTGSFENKHIEWAKELIYKIQPDFDNWLLKDYTFLFEICHRSDPHIVEENEKVILLAIRNIEKNDLSLGTPGIFENIPYTKFKEAKFIDIIREMRTAQHEGYVLYGYGAVPLLKLKSDWYLFCKALARAKDARVLSRAETYALNNEKYKEIFDMVNANKDDFFALDEQDRLKVLREGKMMEKKYPTGDLILIRGLPGAGKSFFVKNIVVTRNICLDYMCPRSRGKYWFEADHYFTDEDGNYNYDVMKISDAHRQCRQKTEDAMAKTDESIIIVSNTFTTEKEMQPYFNLAKKYNYRVHTLIVENRHGSASVHDVPKEKIEVMKNRFNIKL